MTDVCKFLEWDSEFFGSRIARLNRAQPTAGEMRDALDWCSAERIACLYLLADASDSGTTRLAEDNGFHFSDIRLTLLRHETSAPGEWPAGIRIATDDDIKALTPIAGASHTDSRFYSDPGFARERCDELYRVWIENSCRGYAQRVFVGEQDGVAAGYITCHHDTDSGRVGLLGVASTARENGMGGRLISAALRHFADLGFKQTTVVTQGRNAGAQRLYTRYGFLPHRTELWYHRWFSHPAQGNL